MVGFPVMVNQREVEAFYDLVGFVGGLMFGEASHTAIDGVGAQNRGSSVELFSAVMAKNFKNGLVCKLDSWFGTTILSNTKVSSGAAL